jgi:hypothetical protein
MQIMFLLQYYILVWYYSTVLHLYKSTVHGTTKVHPTGVQVLGKYVKHSVAALLHGCRVA